MTGERIARAAPGPVRLARVTGRSAVQSLLTDMKMAENAQSSRAISGGLSCMVPGVHGHHGYTQGTRGVQATPRTADTHVLSMFYTHIKVVNFTPFSLSERVNQNLGTLITFKINAHFEFN